ncbi:MAG: glycosyltransferase family 39 protein [Solirubrobacteraceae bacterium]
MSAGSVTGAERVSRSPWPTIWRVGDRAQPVGWAVAALVALAAVLRFYGLGRQGFWFDEANTALLVHYPPGKMLGLIPQSESTPPLYYCVAWVWSRVFGNDEAGLRSLSAVAGVLTVPVAYVAAAKLVSRRAGVICAALTACNPFLIWYSQEARSYALLVLFTGISLVAFAYARAAPTPRVLASWVVASAVALAIHYYAVAAIVPEAGWLLWEYRDRRAVRVGVGLVALCGLALIPLAVSQNGTGHDSWIAHAPLGPRLRQIVPQFLIGTNAPHRQILKYVAMALALVALGLLGLRATVAERGPALLAGGLALAGLLLALVLAAIGFDDLITRNIIAIWLPAAILISGGLAVGRARLAGALVALALCATGVVATIGIATNPSMQRPNWRPVARALGPAPSGAAGRAILIQHYTTLLPLSLYLPDLRPLRGSAAVPVDRLDVISMTAPGQPLCWWGAACNLIPSVMQPRYDIPGFRPEGLRHVRQFTIMALASRRPVLLTRAAVAGALTTTSLRRDELLVQRSPAPEARTS